MIHNFPITSGNHIDKKDDKVNFEEPNCIPSFFLWQHELDISSRKPIESKELNPFGIIPIIGHYEIGGIFFPLLIVIATWEENEEPVCTHTKFFMGNELFTKEYYKSIILIGFCCLFWETTDLMHGRMIIIGK